MLKALTMYLSLANLPKPLSHGFGLDARQFLKLQWGLIFSLIGAYLATKFIFFQYLPEKWFGDSAKLLDIAYQLADGAGSYAATADIFSYFPPLFIELLVVSLACMTIWLTISACRHTYALIFTTLLLVLAVPQILMVPNKETLVVMLTLAIIGAAKYLKDTWFIIAVGGLYLAYGLTIRNYYLLILLVWAGFVAWSYLRGGWKGMIIIGLLLGLLFVPDAMFETMQGQRDRANEWGLFVAQSDNRTAFFNPWPPTTLSNFIMNYVYAAFKLNLPIFAFGSYKELLLVISVVFCGVLVFCGLFQQNAHIKILAQLFLAHVCILWIFEPDLGSYFRHFTSVFLYLVPALTLLGKFPQKP